MYQKRPTHINLTKRDESIASRIGTCLQSTKITNTHNVRQTCRTNQRKRWLNGVKCSVPQLDQHDYDGRAE